MDIPTFIIKGKNPKTNRINKRTYLAFDEASAIKQMEADGFVEPFEVELINEEPATTRQIDYARELNIPIPMNATLQEMSRRISAAVDNNVDFSQFHPIVGKGWEGWSKLLHYEKSQIARQARAKSAQYKPIELSEAQKAALFAASNRDEAYVTTLENCHCLDFYRTGKPCKHMYRLAHELGLYDLSVVPDTPAGEKSFFSQPLSVGKLPAWLIHLILFFCTAGIGNIIYLVIKTSKKDS